jgi:hypothetical protein
MISTNPDFRSTAFKAWIPRPPRGHAFLHRPASPDHRDDGSEPPTQAELGGVLAAARRGAEESACRPVALERP